jgi:hypothetical protein
MQLHRRAGGTSEAPEWRVRARRYNPDVSEPNKPVVPAAPAPTERRRAEDDDKVICERCGAEMFRMHAVWRCPACRYKTDCCGW